MSSIDPNVNLGNPEARSVPTVARLRPSMASALGDQLRMRKQATASKSALNIQETEMPGRTSELWREYHQ